MSPGWCCSARRDRWRQPGGAGAAGGGAGPGGPGAGAVRAGAAGAAAHVPLAEPFFERLVADSLKLPARVWKATLEGLFAFDDAAELGRIAAPTLLVWGEWDRWLPREEEDHLGVVIPGARVVMYPATGHSPNWERPERVAADLDAFMREA